MAVTIDEATKKWVIDGVTQGVSAWAGGIRGER